MPKETATSSPSGMRRTSPYPVVAVPGSIPRARVMFLFKHKGHEGHEGFVELRQKSFAPIVFVDEQVGWIF